MEGVKKIAVEFAVVASVLIMLGGCHHRDRAPKPRPAPTVASTTTTSEASAQSAPVVPGSPQHTG